MRKKGVESYNESPRIDNLFAFEIKLLASKDSI